MSKKTGKKTAEKAAAKRAATAARAALLKATAYEVTIGPFRVEKPTGVTVRSANILVNGHVVGEIEGDTDRGYWPFLLDEFEDVPVPGNKNRPIPEIIEDVKAGFDHWDFNLRN